MPYCVATGKTRLEKWADVAERVALGNSLLHPAGSSDQGMHQIGVTLVSDDQKVEFDRLNHHLRQASLLMSGRHLQHGDASQPTRPMEVFTNCATAASSFLTFYLLLNGAGVGRSYDDALTVVDWNKMPIVVPVIDRDHGDVQSGEINALDRRTAEHLYAGRTGHTFVVPDSREGWAKAIEVMETLTFSGEHREDILLIDFSQVRPRGAPIAGMQGRPASGPGPLMEAISKVARLRDAGMAPWRAAMFADHYLAECVLVGGARRAARMSTKFWKDEGILEYIAVKKGGFLWSSNNSVTVDEEFWDCVAGVHTGNDLELTRRAQRVYAEMINAAYMDGTGEPGFINVDMLTENNEGLDVYNDGEFAASSRYQLSDAAKGMFKTILEVVKTMPYKMITNPCGEICLLVIGGYCVIGDVVPYHAKNDNDAEDAFRTAVRALIRTNLMDSLYKREVLRTNRIGVGMTGIHEYAWHRFGFGWKALVNESESLPFWKMLSRFKRAVLDEATKFSKELGVVAPHTNTTIKPAGTTSKLFALSEGAHLPAMREYLRWVQFRSDDPLIKVWEAKGYPVKKLVTYGGTTVVGFPTQPEICRLDMGDDLVTAPEATPEEQFEWLRLLEKWWIVGMEEDGVTSLSESGNQVSYTLKYDQTRVSFSAFERLMMERMPTVRACSVMPTTDASAYEYTPEQGVNKADYELIVAAIRHDDEDDEMHEDVDFEHIDCASGACPISFDKEPITQSRAA